MFIVASYETSIADVLAIGCSHETVDRQENSSTSFLCVARLTGFTSAGPRMDASLRTTLRRLLLDARTSLHQLGASKQYLLIF